MGCVNAKSDTQRKYKEPVVPSTKMMRSQRLDCRKRSLQASDKILENVTIIAHKIDEQSQILARQTVQKHYLFNELSDEEKDTLVSQLIHVRGVKDQYLFKQKDKGSCFFIIKEGRVAVQINGEQVKVLEKGQMFGQLALVFCAARSASIKCLDERTSFLAMKAYTFQKTMQQITLRNASKLQNIVSRVKIFSYLTNKQKHIITNNLVRQPFKKDEVIFMINEPANSFHIIEKGSVRIQIPGKQLIIIKEEDSFGENSFYKDGQRSGSAYANEEGTILISIGRQGIQNCLGESVTGLIHHNIKKWALTRSALFSKYSAKQIDIIAQAFQVKSSKGNSQVLMPKGKHPTGFIICMEGQIDGQPPGSMFCDDFYGKKQNALQEDIVKNNKGAFAVLEFKALSKINQNIKMEKNWVRKTKPINSQNTSLVSNVQTENQKAISHQKAKNEFQSLEMLQKLGQGQFGEVYLVRNPNHGNVLYAIKCISISQIKREGIQGCLVSERNILSQITYPAIVGFVQAYKDIQFVYFLMEFINGVEMFDVLREIGLVNKSIAQYYIGTLILAVEYLHGLGVIYRDLKPENSVVGHDGKVYLIDLGTAKHLTEKKSFRTFTIIGTPHYMAPEVFQGKGYTFEADYWSLGVMLYEFLYGTLPYGNNATDPYGIFAEIMSRPLKFPTFLKDPDAELVIAKLLSKNFFDRSINNGFSGIKKMSYFANMEWNSLISKASPPYIPKKFRNISPTNYYKNLKGDLFLGDFYRKQNKKDPKIKPLSMDQTQIQIWDSQTL